MSGPLVRIAVALVIVPIYLHAVGAARYGVISILWALVGYTGFLDLGLSRALANALAKMRAAPQAERARVMTTTLVVNLLLGLFGGGAIFLATDWLLTHYISAPLELRPEIVRALPWVAAMIPATLASGVCIGALESRERFAAANVLQILSTTLGQVAPAVLALTISPSLVVIVPGIACAGIAGSLAAFALAYRQEGPLRLGDFDRRQAANLLSYGSWVTISSIISPILTSVDQMLIGAQLGVTAVAYYAVAMTLVLRSQIIPAALARTLFPRLSTHGPSEANALATRAMELLAWAYAAICAPAIVLSPIFFKYWIGADFAQNSAPVAELLFLGAWINGLAFIPYNLLQGQGRPDITGTIHAVEIIPFLGILWLLTKRFGIEGAAIAWSVRVLVDAFALWWVARLPLACAFRIFPAALALVVSIVIARAIESNLILSIAAAAAMGLISTALAIFFSADLRRGMQFGVSWLRA